jgi:hypothetical protein
MKLRLNATFGDFILRGLLWVVVSVVTLGLGSIWVAYDSPKWFIERIEVVEDKKK